MTRSRGFTLIELMIVLGIIAILAALAIPNLVDARKAANEVAAVGTLKTVTSGQSLYRETDKDGNGYEDYGSMSQLADAGVIDDLLRTGTRAGYYFETDGCTDPGLNTSYFYTFGNPLLLDGTGNRGYVTNYQGVVYYTQQKLISGGISDLRADGTIPTGVYPIK